MVDSQLFPFEVFAMAGLSPRLEPSEDSAYEVKDGIYLPVFQDQSSSPFQVAMVLRWCAILLRIGIDFLNQGFCLSPY